MTKRLEFLFFSFFIGIVGITGAVATRHSALADSASAWGGPKSGPQAVRSKRLIYVAVDFKNGGVTGVYRGVESAAKELGWEISVLNGSGNNQTIHDQLMQILKDHIDGVVVAGFQISDFPDALALAKKEKVVLVGWHAAKQAGPSKDLFFNVSTDLLKVATVAAKLAISSGKGKVGAIIFTDSRFEVAQEKAKKMRQVIEQCKQCKVLSVEDIAISNADQEIPLAVKRLDKKFGKLWTHSLAINDVYFDNMNFPLVEINRADIVNISAGDGSNKAISRIHSGLSQQLATIAEPLNEEGWQIVDELNRAFTGASPNGYIPEPLLITRDTSEDQQSVGYQAAYRAIWKVK